MTTWTHANKQGMQQSLGLWKANACEGANIYSKFVICMKVFLVYAMSIPEPRDCWRGMDL